MFIRMLYGPFLSTMYRKEIIELRTDLCFVTSAILQSSMSSGMLFDFMLLKMLKIIIWMYPDHKCYIKRICS